MMDMPWVNAMITAHVKTTKDKLGEISLTLYLLNRTYDEQLPHLPSTAAAPTRWPPTSPSAPSSSCKKLEKLHPDYYIEFEEDVNKLLTRRAHHARLRTPGTAPAPKWQY
jgi:hypothetical protein